MAKKQQTVEDKARRTVLPNVICSKCKTVPYPRGFIVNLGLCWTCCLKG